MELKVALYYKNAYAHFTLTREHKYVYHADLITYDGAVENAPSNSVLILRGARCWWGSSEDKELVTGLGDCIDAIAEELEFFKGKKEVNDKVDEHS